MKTALSIPANLPQIPGSKICILQALWFHEHSDRLVEASREILNQAGCATIDLVQVPGSYEIPLTAKLLAKEQRYDAIIVYGIILKGETDHYEVILQTCIRELGRVMYEFEVPIIMEILPVHSEEQITARTSGAHNKGIEAALAVIDIITLYRARFPRKESACSRA